MPLYAVHVTPNVLGGDHGPFNSWDRQVFIAGDLNASDEQPFKQFDVIRQNIFIANYQSQEAIDTDDGSSYFHVHNNVLVYGNGGLKSDFGGHDNIHWSNVYAFITHGMSGLS